MVVFIYFCFSVWAADTDSTMINFKVIVPDSVEVNETFRIVFEINTEEGKVVKFPDFKGFKVISGPSKSSSLSTIMQNGIITKDFKISYTYILIAEKEGEFFIEPASILVDDVEYETESVSIKVVKEITNRPSGNRKYREERPQERKREKKNDPDVIFI